VRPPVIAPPVRPRPSAVFHLDPEAIPADFGAQGERATVPGGAVEHFFPHSLCSVMFVLRLRCGFSFWLRRSCAGGCVVILVA